MSTVDRGRDLYRKAHHPAQHPTTYLDAKPGTVDFGRLLGAARRGDHGAQQVVRQWAARGNQPAADVLDGAGSDGSRITEGSEPTADNVT